MVSPNDLKNGMTIIFNGHIHQVVEFQHVKPGKGHAFVRTRLKNLKTGQVIDNIFKAKEEVEQAIIERHVMEYLYKDADNLILMDTSNYEQMEVPISLAEDLLPYLKENEEVTVVMYEEKAIDIVLPFSVELKAVFAPPGVKGDTATGGTKLDRGIPHKGVTQARSGPAQETHMDDETRTRKLLDELIKLMNENDLAELEIEEEGCRIRLRKTESRPEQPVIISTPAPPAEAPAEQPPAKAAHGEQPGAQNDVAIKSPMVGTFYRAPSPDADPFADTGDSVTEESVVCIIEAMKVMNEIKAECEGTIKELLVSDGEPVEYGQPLFLVEPA